MEDHDMVAEQHEKFMLVELCSDAARFWAQNNVIKEADYFDGKLVVLDEHKEYFWYAVFDDDLNVQERN